MPTASIRRVRPAGLGRAGVDLQRLFVTPSLAWRLIPSQTVGAGVTFAYQRFSAEGLNAFATRSIAPSELTNRGNEFSVAYTDAIKGTLDGRNSIPAPFGGRNANISLGENIFALSYG